MVVEYVMVGKVSDLEERVREVTSKNFGGTSVAVAHEGLPSLLCEVPFSPNARLCEPKEKIYPPRRVLLGVNWAQTHNRNLAAIVCVRSCSHTHSSFQGKTRLSFQPPAV